MDIDCREGFDTAVSFECFGGEVGAVGQIEDRLAGVRIETVEGCLRDVF